MTTDVAQRSALRRVAITALNLVCPGLGLIRVGDVRRGLLLAIAPIGLLLASILMFELTPAANFRWSVAYILVLATGFIATLILSFLYTWRRSRIRASVYRKWSRWYGLLAIVIAVNIILQMTVNQYHRFYKPFYMPAESMAPTLEKGDKIIADMRFHGPFAIGDIILIETPSGTYVKRIAALAGDRIRMANGVPIVNGRPAQQQSRGMTSFSDGTEAVQARLVEERLPGAGSPHFILDIKQTDLDDMPERTVPAGHLFVLGDNRDRSADSRVPAEFMGVDMVPLDKVVGRPLFIHWSRDRSRIGTEAVH